MGADDFRQGRRGRRIPAARQRVPGNHCCMANDPVSEIESILTEADSLIRRRMKQRKLQAPHVVIAVTGDGAAVVRSNCGPDMLTDIAKGLGRVAREMTEPGATKH